MTDRTTTHHPTAPPDLDAYLARFDWHPEPELIAYRDEGAWREALVSPGEMTWDAGLAELGKRGGIFQKHGLNLEILYTQAGPESIQALIGGSIDIATAPGVSAAVGTFAKGPPSRIIGHENVSGPDQDG